MRYPILTMTKTKEIADQLTASDGEPAWDLDVTWVGSGRDVDLDALVTLVDRKRKEWGETVNGAAAVSAEDFEGRLAGEVHRVLRDLPVETLDDPGFWRYLALRHFWWFILEREAGPISRGNVMTYVDGERECVPFRMYLRAQAIRDGDDYSLASALPSATDFWRSHVIRVRTGTAPPLARSFARLQEKERMPVGTVRPFARQINRLWSNIVFDVWSEDDCDRLLGELYENVSGSCSADDETA